MALKRLLILLALIVPLGGMAVLLRTMVVEPDREAQLENIPIQVGEWRGQDLEISESTAASLQATHALLRAYQRPDGTYLTLFIAYFRDQKYGSQIHSPRHCLPGGGWVVADLHRIPFRFGDREVTANSMKITKRQYVDQMFYWFQTRSGELSSEYSLKFDLVRNSLLLRPTDAAMIRLTINRGNRSVEECQQLVEDFVGQIATQIEAALPFESITDGNQAGHQPAAADPVG